MLADGIPTLCWVANRDGYIVWYNKRWHDYCGSTAESMEGWGWTAVHDPDCLPEMIENWTAAIVSGRPFEMTFPLRGADGVFRPFLTRVQPVRDASGQVARWFGVNTDISNQLTAERALGAERDLSRDVLEGMAEGFALMDPDFRILALNAEAMRLESCSPADFIGRTDAEFLEDKAQAAIIMETDRRIMESGRVETLEEAISPPDGRPTATAIPACRC